MKLTAFISCMLLVFAVNGRELEHKMFHTVGNLNYKKEPSGGPEKSINDSKKTIVQTGTMKTAPNNVVLFSTSLYVNDNSTAFDSYTTAVGNNTNTGSATSPFATISYAVSQAQEGDTIYVDAGVYPEQVIIDKGITLIGAGKSFTQIIPPATPLVPAPGPFTEIGLLESMQGIGPVHIRGFSVNSNSASQNIIIQGSGSVRDCQLTNGNQGIFFRVASAVSNAIIEDNVIVPDYIGINCQGAGMNAVIRNNTIGKPGGNLAAVFAGLDFGPLPALTIQNNILRNYNSVGLEVNSISGNYTNNSFQNLNNAPAIRQTSGNVPTATCNWFGTTSPTAIRNQISGNLIYTPSLTSGTDTDPLAPGFQIASGSCAGNILFVNDNTQTGDQFTLTTGNDANPGTRNAPLATLTEAVNRAVEGDVIYVDAGTFIEQVTLTKGLTLIGAGPILTKILKPAAVVPPPGPFQEPGVIQTSQNIGDVHIRSLSVTGDASTGVTPLILQTGGSLYGSSLQSGNQGIFVRIDPATNLSTRTFTIENNSIQAEYISINVAGTRLTATLLNNTLNASNPGFSCNLFAGVDFGTMPRLTISGNFFNTYSNFGLLVNSSNANINQNSFTGTGNPAISNSGPPFINATCNWFGTADLNSIASRLTPGILFSPWLSSGTDNSPETGFQPAPGVCNVRQTQYYVNDNNRTGDIYTSAVGNNSNSGMPNAPLATLAAALTRAQAGDTITVDAGTYSNILTITKNVYIRGAGTGLTVLNGAAGTITAPPGSGETGIIQSIPGLTNVVIEKMTIDGTISNEMYGIFIQGGGRVSYCEIRNCASGYYFRSTSTESRTAMGNDNYIHHVNSFGILFAGNGLNATASNNLIDLSSSPNGLGFLAGYGGDGDVGNLTIVNNSIINFSGFGILLSTLQPAQIHNNSMTGLSGNYIINLSSIPADASCNWYGTAAAATITPLMSGAITFSPWLSDGTDADPAFGFQPVPGTCTGTAMDAVLISKSDVTCNGAANGTITITLNGGLAPFTYNWSKDNTPGFSNQQNPVNLSPGTYSLLVTDANGTTDTINNITITEPPLLSATASGTSVKCFNGADGSATVTVNGGTSPYTYLWSNGSNLPDIGNLGAGNYLVTVTDANGCTVQAAFSVTQPIALTLTVTGTTATCNGSVTATVSGGTAPYSYNWSNGSVAASQANIPPGTYSVVVTDSNQCTISGSFTITGNSPINPTTTVVPATCFCTATGSITITGTNSGTAPFQYNLNGSAFQSGNVFNNLAAGTYVVGVKDANGCSDFVTRIITQPSLLTVVLDSTRIPCFGTTSGRIYITASGGNTGKLYNWTGPNGFTSTAQDLLNVGAGTYQLTVTDAKGCTAALQVTLSEFPATQIAALVTPVSCRGGNNGSINTTITGGTGNGFSISWTGPLGFTSTAEDLTGLLAGNYRITVRDNGSGCVVQQTFTITQPAAALAATLARTNVTSCSALGSITVTASGGTAPYSYSLDGLNYQTFPVFTNLAGGTYTVWVKDANGCTVNKTQLITDAGNDANEPNNSKNRSTLMAIGSLVTGRIAPAPANDPADWFTFTTPAGNPALYTVTFTDPSVTHSYQLFPQSNTAPALLPADSTLVSKTYLLNAGVAYYIKVTGTGSLTCYQLTVTAPVLGQTNNRPAAQETLRPVYKLQTEVFPNPHQGAFGIRITAPEDEKALVEIINSVGQVIVQKQVNVSKGVPQTIYFNQLKQAVLFYRVRTNKETNTGKIIGPN